MRLTQLCRFCSTAVCAIFLLLCRPVFVSAQVSFLLTDSLYGPTYTSLPGEEKLAQRLDGLSLDQLLQQGIISRDGMAGLTLPLGVHGSQQSVDPQAGLRAMWLAKARFMDQRSLKADPQVMVFALASLEQLTQESAQLDLLLYRDQYLSSAVRLIQGLHQNIPKEQRYSPERQTFMDLITRFLSPNVMLGYNLQELLPTHVGPYHQWINPLFKAYYLDRLLREFGPYYLAGFPSRYDALLSFGPFQMTQRALDGIADNPRLPSQFTRYRAMSELSSLEAQAEAAALLAYSNWERLAFFLQSFGGLENFNQYFSEWEAHPGRKRELGLFIAGTTAAMHHLPKATWNLVQEYIKQHSDLSQLYHDIFDYARENQVIQDQASINQLDKYYRSAAEGYLIMKVYHRLITH